MKHKVPKSMNVSCFVSGRTPILYPFIRRAVQLTVATNGTSHCYQLQAQSYQHSGKVKAISRRNHLGPICGFRPNKMKYWLDIQHLSDTTEKMGMQWGSLYHFRTTLWFNYEASFVPYVQGKSRDKNSRTLKTQTRKAYNCLHNSSHSSFPCTLPRCIPPPSVRYYYLRKIW